jgi:Zn-dependent protease with chaperone function
MQFVHFIWIISLLIARQVGTQVGLDSSQRGWICTIGIVVGLGLIGKVGAVQAALRSNEIPGMRPPRMRGGELFAVYRNWIEWIWIGGLFWTTICIGWPASVQSMMVVESTALELLLYALPSLLLTFLLELADYQLACYHHEQSSDSARVVDPNATPAPPISFARQVILSARHGWLILLAPTLILVAFSDLLAMSSPWLSEPLKAAVLAIGSLGLISFGFPWFISKLWQTRPLKFHPAVHPTCRSLGIRDAQILTWDTDQRVSNAAVVGWLPACRRLLISDGLLESLTADQIRMIVLHEIAHIRRNHFLLRMLPVLISIVILWITLWATSRSEFTAATADISSGFASNGPLSMPASWAISLEFIFYSFAAIIMIASVAISCWIARQTEYDADHVAVRLASESKGLDCVVQDPAESLSDALQQLVPTNRQSQSSWLHPSIDARVHRLRNLAHR